MSVIAPVDSLELKSAVDFCCTKSKGPVYLESANLEKRTLLLIQKKNGNMEKLEKIENGKNVCFITYGPIISKIYEIKKKTK